MEWLNWFRSADTLDVIGRVLLTVDEIEAERLAAHEAKLNRAKTILVEELGILRQKPLYHTHQSQEE